MRPSPTRTRPRPEAQAESDELGVGAHRLEDLPGLEDPVVLVGTGVETQREEQS